MLIDRCQVVKTHKITFCNNADKSLLNIQGLLISPYIYSYASSKAVKLILLVIIHKTFSEVDGEPVYWTLQVWKLTRCIYKWPIPVY